MATDGPTPTPCDPEVYEHGTPVVLLDGSSNAVERWVRAVAATADARVDWHYAAGRGVVLHLGDADSLARVDAAIDAMPASDNPRILRRIPAGEPR